MFVIGPLRGLRQFGLGGGFLEPGVCLIGALRGLRFPGPAGVFLIGATRVFDNAASEAYFMEPHGGVGPIRTTCNSVSPIDRFRARR